MYVHQIGSTYCTTQVQTFSGRIERRENETPDMIDNRTLDELTSKITDALPDGIKLLKEDAEKNIRAVLESTFSKMNLVSREEFDVQTAVLNRTIEKLKQLEAQVSELEKQK